MQSQIKVSNYTINLGLNESLGSFLADLDYSKLFVLVDENTKIHCLPILGEVIQDFIIIEIESGEINKNLDTCRKIWSALIDNSADRHSILINLGGGVIGDMGGFCAGTFMRGIRFIQVPTTLLSQVDASVGGKLGIDYQSLKNIIGLFQDPIAVFAESNFLKTLIPREVESGFAEIIKHGLIRDANLWKMVSNLEGSVFDLEKSELNNILHTSISIKKEIVEIDPFEKGLRKILNFGHTIGHGVESFYLEQENSYLHGEAIAIGMICESYLSFILNGLIENEMLYICKFLANRYALKSIQKQNYEALINLMSRDKKNKNKKILFSLLNSIGSCDFGIECSPSQIVESIDFYNELI